MKALSLFCLMTLILTSCQKNPGSGGGANVDPNAQPKAPVPKLEGCKISIDSSSLRQLAKSWYQAKESCALSENELEIYE